jgi:hypothetical protein
MCDSVAQASPERDLGVTKQSILMLEEGLQPFPQLRKD